MRKFIFRLALLLVICYAILLAYGIANYPQAPYKSCGASKFCDKQTHERSSAEYLAFSKWEWLFKHCLPLALAAGGVMIYLRKKQ